MLVPRFGRYSLPSRLVLPESKYQNRRAFLGQLGLASMALLTGCGRGSPSQSRNRPGTPTGFDLPPRPSDKFYPAKQNPAFGPLPDRSITRKELAGSYNNFYEFSTVKEDVNRLSAALVIDPWTISVAGLVAKPFEIGFEDLLTKFPLEERIYRMRCVEAWSMVVPWTGFPLKSLIDYCQPLSSATHVRFLSFNKPEQAPGMNGDYPFPYYEGLRMDEARHELAFVVTGAYGHAMPKQHGAPLRIALPWKYGYKGAKSVVKIEFINREPKTFWNDLAPDEYGFYSNVDPEKPHPRWSQAYERDINTGDEIETLKYNGYEKYVASLYPQPVF
jgi:methionine sulfoxide reductase catalytic subunit